MNKLVSLGILVALFGCAGAWLAASSRSNHHEARWFSKSGTNCAMVRYNDSLGEWNVYNQVETAIFPSEKEALVFARNVCGGGEIKIASQR